MERPKSPYTAEFSLAKLHQLYTGARDTTAQHFYRRQMREYYFNHFETVNNSFSIPSAPGKSMEPVFVTPVAWEQLESHCNLPVKDRDGNSYALTPSRTNAHNGYFLIEYHTKHPITDYRGIAADRSGHLLYDTTGRMVGGFLNKFTETDSQYEFSVTYDCDGYAQDIQGFKQNIRGTRLPLGLRFMPLFYDQQVFTVDAAEYMRQSR